MRNINYIVLHCTASPQTQTVQAILSYWKNVLGWAKPGYHHLIEPNGTVHDLVPVGEPSNGVAGHNKNSIHISYIGGVTTIKSNPLNAAGTPIDNRTREQKSKQEILVRKYSQMFPTAVICGHRDFSPDKNKNGVIEPNEWIKACPSFSVAEWLKSIGFKSAMPAIQLTTTSNLNLRDGAGTQFKILQVIPAFSKVKKLALVPGWMYIEVAGSNATGWVSEAFISK